MPPARYARSSGWLLLVLLALVPVSGAQEKRWCPVVSTLDSAGFTDFVQRCRIYVKSDGRWRSFVKPI